jgi:putative oligomerization/nucleic acid binding protein
MSGNVNLPRLYALLALWLVLLLAPGVLEILGTFGHFDINTEIVGPIIGMWVVGYLVQFFIFLLLSRIVDPGILAWFAASSLPWAIDWTTPVSPLFLVLWAGIAVAFAMWIASHARRDAALRENGAHVDATVLKVYQPFMNVIVNGAYIKRKLQLRIDGLKGSAPYEADMSCLFMFGDVPSAGDKIPLLVDPQNPQRFEYDKTAADAGDASSGSASGDLAAMQASSASSAVGDAPSMADELGKLAALHKQGALTDSEFDDAKRKLLA